MINYYLILLTILGLIILLIRLAIDYFSNPLNQFFDEKLVKRFLWLWLPFYTLQRIIKEVILKK